MKHIAPQFHQRRRGGFTLIELLIVIGLISFMAAMGVILVQGMQGKAKETRTKAVIKLIDEQLAKRTEGFDRWFEDQKEDLLRTMNRQERSKVFSGDTQTFQIQGKKLFFEGYFPQNLSEIPRDKNYEAYWLDGSGASKNTVDAAADAGEVLYYMLTEMRTFGTDAVNEGEFDLSMVGDTDGDGLMEFIDGWGNPLRFYRWPTQLVKPGGTINRDTTTLMIEVLPANAQLNIDPDDPTGALRALVDLGTLDPTAFAVEYHTLDTWHTPLIVSAGEDGKLGLYEPSNTGQSGHLAKPEYVDEPDPTKKQELLDELYDNISSGNVKAQ